MEKYAMRRLLWAALLLLYCACGCLAVVQQLPRKGRSGWQAYTVAANDKSGEEWHPIQITLSADNVDKVLHRCAMRKTLTEEERKTAMRLTEKEDDILCDEGTGITWSKRNLLLREILPAAIKLHRDRLNVARVDGRFFSTGKSVNYFKSKCPEVDVTEANEAKGFNSADFVLFVGLTGYSRTATICTEELLNNRPTSAYITFHPKDIVDTRSFVRLAAHQIAHGLGFEYGRMVKMNKIIPGGFYYDSYKTHQALKGRVINEAKKHYNCDRLTGMYINQRGSTVSSHWEWIIAKDELMSPYTGEPSGMYYTALTLALFDDMPFYRANFTMAETMSWGNQWDCNFVGKDGPLKKDEIIKAHPEFFCEGETNELRCTSDRFALGVCSKKDIPPPAISDEYHHFTAAAETRRGDLLDGFSVVKPFMETTCEDGSETLMPGSIVSKISRCLNVKDPQFINAQQGNSVMVKGICARVMCDKEKEKVRVQYKGGEGADNSTWHECKEDGEEIQLGGSVFNGGTIVCPKYEEVCTKLPETAPPTIEYEEVVVSEKDEREAQGQTTGPGESGHVAQTSDDGRTAEVDNEAHTERDEETVQRSSASSEPTVTTDPAKNTGPSTPTDVGTESHQPSTTTDGESHTTNRHDTAAAVTLPSTSNPSSADHTVQSHNNVTSADEHSSHTVSSSSLQGTNITKIQLEKALKRANANELAGTDSSAVASYMAPLVLLVCAVAVMMTP